MSVRDIYLFVLLCVCHALGSATSTTSKPTASTLTCPYRTVNYLTHTLAQQCLASSRTSAVTSDYKHSSTNTSLSTSPSTSTAHNLTEVGQTAESQYGSRPSKESQLAAANGSAISSPVTLIETETTTPATSVPATVLVPILPVAADEDSPLESGNFLSFEDWKIQNLIQAGQSEHLGRNARTEQRQPRKRPENVHNTLDSLGDDAEIDIDFSGLVPGGSGTVKDPEIGRDAQSGESQRTFESGHNLQTRGRRKDAGTTSKERFNYASFDCAANVLKSNSEAKNANLVLRENKDLYMLNKCSASNKFIILEMCDDILIDTVVLANFEFFSSSFRTLQVSVSDRYPVKTDKWKSLGTFEARNTREVQAFLVENPVIWARYVRIEFLSHYGTEFYCPVSLIRVHGTTMLEEYKHDLDANAEEEEDDDDDGIDVVASADVTENELVPKAMDESLPNEQQPDIILEAQNANIVEKEVQVFNNATSNSSKEAQTEASNNATTPNELAIVHIFTPSSSTKARDLPENAANRTCIRTTQNHAQGSPDADSSMNASTVDNSVSPTTVREHRSSGPPIVLGGQTVVSSSAVQRESHSSSISKNGAEAKKSAHTGTEQNKANATTRDATRSTPVKQQGSGSQPQPASPTLQESFFKSVQKRLSMLESNSSLSLQYIEDQSRALRDAFRKVEQRQLSKTTSFLDTLNHTVLSELREFRSQYDQLWQSTVIELELQRERYHQESQAMNARLGVLADELIFQRRVSILQMVLILVCLGLVLFSRGALNNYLELPLVQSVLARSPSSRWTGPSGDSQTTSPAMVRTRSAHQLGSKQGILKRHSRGLSEDSNNETLSASELYSPPTPVSFDGYSDAELAKADDKSDILEFDPVNIERPSTSPPVLPSVEDPTTPKSTHFMDDSSIESRVLTPVSSIGKVRSRSVKNQHLSSTERHLTWDLPE